LAAAFAALAFVVVGFFAFAGGFTSEARFSLRRPGRERGRFPITPESSVTPWTIARSADGSPASRTLNASPRTPERARLFYV
jgi:hypothetical protein